MQSLVDDTACSVRLLRAICEIQPSDAKMMDVSLRAAALMVVSNEGRDSLNNAWRASQYPEFRQELKQATWELIRNLDFMSDFLD